MMRIAETGDLFGIIRILMEFLLDRSCGFVDKAGNLLKTVTKHYRIQGTEHLTLFRLVSVFYMYCSQRSF